MPDKNTVLVVEDDHALRELYRAALIGAGYAVVAVEDGLDALRYLDGHTPTLIVLDLGLPRLRGQDVQREVASRPDARNIPIIIITASDTHGLPGAGVERVLGKPISCDTLLAEIEGVLRSARRRRPTYSWPEQGLNRQMPTRTVLVVDDEASMQTLLRNFLEEKTYSVKIAGSVGEAISVLEHSIIDAVILDVRMPRRSGLDLLGLIRLNRNRRDFPVLILTGATLEPDERLVIDRAAGKLFYKSQDLEPLADHLARVMH